MHIMERDYVTSCNNNGFLLCQIKSYTWWTAPNRVQFNTHFCTHVIKYAAAVFIHFFSSFRFISCLDNLLKEVNGPRHIETNRRFVFLSLLFAGLIWGSFTKGRVVVQFYSVNNNAMSWLNFLWYELLL